MLGADETVEDRARIGFSNNAMFELMAKGRHRPHPGNAHDPQTFGVVRRKSMSALSVSDDRNQVPDQKDRTIPLNAQAIFGNLSA